MLMHLDVSYYVLSFQCGEVIIPQIAGSEVLACNFIELEGSKHSKLKIELFRSQQAKNHDKSKIK